MKFFESLMTFEMVSGLCWDTKQTANGKKRYINWIYQEFEGHTKDLNKGSNELKFLT